MLLSKNVISEVTQIMKGEDFYRPNHQLVFEVIVQLFTNGEPVDPVTVAAEIDKSGKLTRIGGAPYIHTLISTVPTASNAASYAKIVVEKARLRKLIEIGTRMVQFAYAGDEGGNVDEVISLAEHDFRTLDTARSEDADFHSMIESWRQWSDDPSGIIRSPWPELNTKYLGGGFRKGKVYIIGGKPGDGKSLLGLNCIEKALTDDRKAQIFSMEMGREEVGSRLLAAGAWAPIAEIFRKKMSEDTLHRVNEYIDNNPDAQLNLVDRILTVEQIVARIRRYQPDIAFVDYLQIVRATNPKEMREQQVSHISRTLKQAARELNVAIIAASQLNKDGDLRESQSQLMDADFVLTLDRSANSGTVRTVIKKNRDGQQGDLEFTFRGDISRIGD